MATYYIRADGSAANKAAATGPTTDATKCMSSTTHNAETFAAGDQILLSDKGGAIGRINLVSSGTSGNPIVYGKAPGETPAININDYPLYASAKTDVTIQDLILTSGAPNTTAVLLAGACQRITIQRCTLTASQYGIQTSGAAASCVFTGNTFVTCITNVFYAYGVGGTGNTFSNNICPNGAGGVRLTSQAATTISGNTFGTTPAPVILNTTQTAGATVINSNTFAGPTTAGAYVFDFESCTLGTISATGNTITGGSIIKVYINASTAVTTFDTLTIASPTAGGVYIAGASANVTIKNSTLNCAVSIVGASHHIHLLGNEIYGFTSDLVILNSAHDCVVAFNEIHDGGQIDTTAAGDGVTSHGTDYNNQVHNNLIYNMSGTGLAMVETSHGWAYGNIIVNCGNPTGVGAATQVRAGIYLDLTGINAATGESWTVRDNIVVGNGPRQVFVSAACKDLVRMDYNCYFGEVDAAKFASIDDGSTNITWAVYHATYEPHSTHEDTGITASNVTSYAGSTATRLLAKAAAQLATDQAAVLAAAANVRSGTTILGQAGTLDVTADNASFHRVGI